MLSGIPEFTPRNSKDQNLTTKKHPTRKNAEFQRKPVAKGRTTLTFYRSKVNAANQSVAFSGLRREIFLEFAALVLVFLAVRRWFTLFDDVGPFFGIFGVDLQPVVEARFGVRFDRIDRAFRFANTTVDTFVGMNDEHVLALIETIDRANFHTVHEFAFDAVVGDEIGHESMICPSLFRASDYSW